MLLYVALLTIGDQEIRSLTVSDLALIGLPPSAPVCDVKCSNYRDAAAPIARTACSSATTTAPSPIAAPTRLTDPDRTSPMANTPRTLVSSGNGRPDRLFDQLTSDGTSEPVRMKFLASKVTALSLSQVVAGSAPMKRKRWRIGFSVSSPVTLLRQRTRSSCFSGVPCRATISVWVNTSILSVASMRSMR